MYVRKQYLAITILLFLTEVLIALFVNNKFIRSYVGDFLVVILIYSFIRSFFRLQVLPTTLGVLLFSFVIETLQYFNFVKLLGLEKILWIRIILGNSFSWFDLLAYFLGVLLILLLEDLMKKYRFLTFQTYPGKHTL
jgi:hypothetical protein